MFPASSEGNTNTFARPATELPGAFREPTSRMSAASPCKSPSTARGQGLAARSGLTAFRTSVTELPRPLPRVLKDSNATIGSSPTMRDRSASAASAMSANCSAVGYGTTVQSVNVSTIGAPTPKVTDGHIKGAGNRAHTVRGPYQPERGPQHTSAVVWDAPGDTPVNPTRCHKRVGKKERGVYKLARLVRGHSLGLAPLPQLPCGNVGQRVRERIEDFQIRGSARP